MSANRKIRNFTEHQNRDNRHYYTSISRFMWLPAQGRRRHPSPLRWLRGKTSGVEANGSPYEENESEASAPERHRTPRNTKIGLTDASIRTFRLSCGFWRKGVAVARRPFGGFAVIRWALVVGVNWGHMVEMRARRKPRNATPRNTKIGISAASISPFLLYVASGAKASPSPVAHSVVSR